MSPSRRGPAPTLAAGRQLRRLLFVTSRQGLAHNIGVRAADQALTLARDAGHAVVANLPAGLTHPERAIRAVNRAHERHPDVYGVVLLGGYDVVPSQRLDCLPGRLRARIRPGVDPDDFIVWNDDAYGDPERVGVARLPVSRIPDGRSAAVVLGALTAPDDAGRRPVRKGIRNLFRPFADRVFRSLPGDGRMRRSSPTKADRLPRAALGGSHVYLVLHGLARDGRHFWGESKRGHPVAIDVGDAPRAGAVVLSGCCWGALAAHQTACDDVDGTAPSPRTTRSSVALASLRNGVRAFVGSTGVNYSPTRAPFDYFAGPLHAAFWRGLMAGVSPSRALLEAKHAFALGMLHTGRRGSVDEAIEFKTLRQYSCLGLGW